MSDNDLELLFSQAPADGMPVELVFGEDEAPQIPPVLAHVSGRITGLRRPVGLRAGVYASAMGKITGLRRPVHGLYNVNVQRPLVARVTSTAQKAEQLDKGTQFSFQDAVPYSDGVRSGWNASAPLSSSTTARFDDAQRMQHLVLARFQQALQLPMARAVLRFENTLSRRVELLSRYQKALQLQVAPNRQRFEDALRRRAELSSAWQRAGQIEAGVATDFGPAIRVGRYLGVRFQNAWSPRPGITHRPEPPQPEPCYVPGLPVELLFDQAVDGEQPVGLVFVCDRHTPAPEPEEPQFVIPLLRVYMTVHTITAHLLPGLERVQLQGIKIDTDDDGYSWRLSASGPEHLLDQLAPISGLPVRVKVSFSGIEFVFAVAVQARSREFGKRSVSVSGASVTSLLGDPYMPAGTFTNASNRTAQQLVLEALEFTGVSLDWQIDDWEIPAGGWSHAGTPLSAAVRIAEAAGAVLRSHRTDAQLIMAPRFKHLPWEWGDVTPNVRMPGQIITKDTLQFEPRVAFNAVYVMGATSSGKKGHVVRRGTAGELLAQDVVDPLITSVDVAGQRGRSILGAAAIQRKQPITVPLLQGGTNPGLILPGYLLEVQEPGEIWRGMVRSISITEDRPKVRQTLIVERT
jgi:hypothetical protein